MSRGASGLAPLPLLAALLAPLAASAQEGDDAWLDALEEEDAAATSDGAWLDGLEEEVDRGAAGEAGDGEDGAGAALRLPLMGETTFSLTNTTLVAWRRNPERREGGFGVLLLDKLELAAQGEAVRLSARVDAVVPIDRPDCEAVVGGLCDTETDLRPERVTLLWSPGDLTLELGDSYAAFGRGIALRLGRKDYLGLDTAVRGGHVRLDRGSLYVEALGGLVNPQNLDPINLELVPDEDALAALSVGSRLGANEELDVAVDAVHVWFTGEPQLDRASVLGWRGTAKLLDGGLEMHGEAHAMRRDDEDRGTRLWGRAVYGSAQATVDRTTVLVQWKDYRNYLLAPSNSVALSPFRVYSDAPQLERDTERFRGVPNSRGGSLEVGYSIPDSAWSANATGIVYGQEDENARRDPWDGILVTHGYATLRRQNETVDAGEVAWSLELTGGYRRESHLEDIGTYIEAGQLDWRVIHGEVDFTIGSGDHSFEVRVEHRDERRLLFDYVDYVRGSVTLTWSFRGILSVSPLLQWNTEKKDLPALWPAGEVRWELLPGSHIRVLGGRNPGGRICSGGICRDVAPFEGVQGELVLRL